MDEPAIASDEAMEYGLLTANQLILPRSGSAYIIRQPVDLDLLLEQIVDDPEQNLPYWAEIWPSGLALADLICCQPKRVRGLRVLELGCGLGLTASAAMRAGAQLTVADYSPQTLALCETNVFKNAKRRPTVVRLNWRQSGPALLEMIGTGFDVVLAADLLYEARDIEPLLGLIEQVMSCDGLLLLAEPGRPVARRFLAKAHDRGWDGPAERHPGPWPDPKDRGVIVHIHALRRG